MKVYVLPADPHGCGHYRLIWPADVLRRQGVEVEIMPPREDSGFMAKTVKGPDGKEYLTALKVPDDADVIVIQRPGHHLQPQMIDLLRGNGIAVVVDMDDDLTDIHPENMAFLTFHPRSPTPFSWRTAMDSCRRATMVTATTKSLLRKYAPRNGETRLLDNYVPGKYLTYDKPETGMFGWAGTTKSHPNDLQVTGGAIQRLIDEGHQFRVVGGESKVRQCARLKEEPEFTGSVGLELWAKTIAENLDVGLAPLAITAFNNAKSRLKGIEYMAVGVPFVCSPREEYRRLVRESGCGLIADSPKEWYSQVKRLMSDEILRKEQAEAGRAYMQGQTYEANAWRWMEAWSDALRIQRA